MRGTCYCFLFLLLAVSIIYARSAGGPDTSEGPLSISCEQVKRVSINEAHVRVRITNVSKNATFLLGTNSDEPSPHPVFLDQWRAEEGWKIVAPCVDVPPPDVIRLTPGQEITFESVLTLPSPSTCKERNLRFEGRFRYKLQYFKSKKQALIYSRHMFASQHNTPSFVLSEAFEFPPPAK